jgi:hypothetical protein
LPKRLLATEGSKEGNPTTEKARKRKKMGKKV